MDLEARDREPARSGFRTGRRAFVVACALLGAAGSAFLGLSFQSEQSRLAELLQRMDRVLDWQIEDRMLLRYYRTPMWADVQALRDDQEQLKDMRAPLADMQQREWASFPWLYLAAGLGLLGGVLACLGRNEAAGVVLLAAPVAPAILAPATLAQTAAFLVGGLIAVTIRSPAGARRPPKPEAVASTGRTSHTGIALGLAILVALCCLSVIPLLVPRPFLVRWTLTVLDGEDRVRVLPRS